MAFNSRKVTFTGARGGQFEFDESDELARGRSGFFGVLRFGKHTQEGDEPATVVVKELLPGKNQVLSYDAPSYSEDFLGKCQVVVAESHAHNDEPLTASNVCLLRAPSGAILGATRRQDGRLVSLTLQQCVDVWGLPAVGEAQVNSGLPTAWEAFLLKRSRVCKEILAMQHIPKHENLISMVDSGEVIQGNRLRVFLVLPYYSAGDLMDKLNSEKVTEEKGREYFLQIARGLDALHKAGFAHRDLKLDNVLIGHKGELIIADFGFCTTTTERSTGSPRLNHNKVGSPLIRAPEIWSQGDDLFQMAPHSQLKTGYSAAKCDIWSLGVILFNLLTRSDFWCFLGESKRWARMRLATQADTGFQHLSRKTARLPEAIPADAADLILEMLTTEPDQRPDTATLLQHKWLRTEKQSEAIVKDVLSSLLEATHRNCLNNCSSNNSAPTSSSSTISTKTPPLTARGA